MSVCVCFFFNLFLFFAHFIFIFGTNISSQVARVRRETFSQIVRAAFCSAYMCGNFEPTCIQLVGAKNLNVLYSIIHRFPLPSFVFSFHFFCCCFFFLRGAYLFVAMPLTFCGWPTTGRHLVRPPHRGQVVISYKALGIEASGSIPVDLPANWFRHTGISI